MNLEVFLKAFVIVAFVALALTIPITYIVVRSRRLMRAMELYHTERMAALERGMELPPFAPEMIGSVADAAKNASRTALLPGLVWFFVGLAILLTNYVLDENQLLAMGLIPAGIGIAYLIYYFFHERNADSK